MEASLILHLEDKAVNIDNSINWTLSCDYGGEGNNNPEEAFREHYVYIAVKPLPQTAASAREHAELFGDRAAAASAHEHDELFGEIAAAASAPTSTADQTSVHSRLHQPP